MAWLVRRLTEEEMADALAEAKEALLAANIHASEKKLPLRVAIATGLSSCGWLFASLDTEREMALTTEVGKALGLAGGIATVEAWDEKAGIREVLDALNKTIEILNGGSQ